MLWGVNGVLCLEEGGGSAGNSSMQTCKRCVASTLIIIIIIFQFIYKNSTYYIKFPQMQMQRHKAWSLGC